MVAMYAQKRGWEVGDTSVDVIYDSEASPRRFEIQLNLPAELSSEQLRRLERVAEGCPLRRALEAGFTFQERLVTTSRLRPPPRGSKVRGLGGGGGSVAFA